MGALNAVVFASLGIVLAIVGFKLFDWMTPGKLDEEILQKQCRNSKAVQSFLAAGW